MIEQAEQNKNWRLYKPGKQMKVPIKKVREGAIIPKYQTSGSAGFDLHAIINKDNPCFTNKAVMYGNPVHDMCLYTTQDGEECLVVNPMSQCVVPTGWVFKIPEGWEIQIRPRSGLSFRNQITVTNSPGTIDSDYCGPNDEVCIILYNLGKQPFIIKQGDRIAQGVLKEVTQANFEVTDNVGEKSRGGFGSTGI